MIGIGQTKENMVSVSLIKNILFVVKLSRYLFYIITYKFLCFMYWILFHKSVYIQHSSSSFIVCISCVKLYWRSSFESSPHLLLTLRIYCVQPRCYENQQIWASPVLFYWSIRVTPLVRCLVFLFFFHSNIFIRLLINCRHANKVHLTSGPICILLWKCWVWRKCWKV